MNLMKPNRILVGCAVKTKNKEYANLETEYLFRTLSEFSNLSNATKIACFTEVPDKSIKTVLENLGVHVKIVSVMDSRHAFSNKIRILEEGLKEDVDIIVMLDTDVVIADDFSKFLSTEKILIKPEDRNMFSISQWQSLYDFFKLELPTERFFTSCDEGKMIPYFNGGVIIIPKIFGQKLLERWIYYLNELLEEKQNLPSIFSENSRYFDQISFTLALSDSNLQYATLPLSMNYPYWGRVSNRENPEELSPYIIHHHHCILENGYIMYCPYKKINLKIDEINKFLKKSTKTKIDQNSITSIIAIRNLSMINNFDEILKRLSNLSLNDTNADLQYYLALSLHNTKKNLDEALTRYSKALEFGFDRKYCIFRIALLDPRVDKIKSLSNKFFFTEIIQNLSDLSINDENPFLQYYLALSFHNTKKNLDEALTRYSKALEFGFEPFWIYLLRGSLHLLQNNLDDAKSDLINAQKINPEHHEVNRQLNLLKNAVPEICDFVRIIKDKSGYINYLEQAIKDKDAYLEQTIKDYQDTINQIKQSKTWRFLHKFDKSN